MSMVWYFQVTKKKTMLIATKEVLVSKLGPTKPEIDPGIYSFVLIYLCVYNACTIYIHYHSYAFVIFMHLHCTTSRT